jgi:hypothetical protein
VWEDIEARLGILKSEFETGQTELQKVMTQQTHLQETLLRISGAIQVLEELLAERRNAIDTDDNISLGAAGAEVQRSAEYQHLPQG